MRSFPTAYSEREIDGNSSIAKQKIDVSNSAHHKKMLLLGAQLSKWCLHDERVLQVTSCNRSKTAACCWPPEWILYGQLYVSGAETERFVFQVSQLEPSGGRWYSHLTRLHCRHHCLGCRSFSFIWNTLKQSRAKRANYYCMVTKFFNI